MANVSFDRITMKSDCDYSQILPSLASLDIHSTGIRIEFRGQRHLAKYLRPAAVSLPPYPPVIVPDDRTLWGYAIRYTPVPPKYHLQDIPIPMPRENIQLCKSYLLAVRQMRKLRTYMRIRLAGIIDAIRMDPWFSPSHIATAEACVAFLDSTIEDCSWTEQMYLENWRTMPEMDVETWNDLCEAVIVFDEGWLKLIGLPLDETVAFDILRSISIQQLCN